MEHDSLKEQDSFFFCLKKNLFEKGLAIKICMKMRGRGRFWTKIGRRYINIHVENNPAKMRLIYRTLGTFHLADAAPFYF